jgi:hypothetical protein
MNSEAEIKVPGNDGLNSQPSNSNKLTAQQLLECTHSFEAQLASEDDPISVDEHGQYTNVLHRSQWRKWLQAWCASLNVAQPTDELLHAPRKKDDSLFAFLNNCRVAGVFFDGKDVKGKPGVFFVSIKQINEHFSGSGMG